MAGDPLPAVWDPAQPIGTLAPGKRGLLVGIAYGAAVKRPAFGASLAVTYPHAKPERRRGRWPRR
jgi:hypothetical protein